MKLIDASHPSCQLSVQLRSETLDNPHFNCQSGKTQQKLEVDQTSLQEVQSALQTNAGQWPVLDMSEEEEGTWLLGLMKAEVRPGAQEQIRLAVDEEMRKSMHQNKVDINPVSLHA